ncbi:MAG: hypothetical protein OXC02_00080, partial [Rhodobacteraceae bacterium]|nr:hypothetical protein [Paracoccaceae bacterium]
TIASIIYEYLIVFIYSIFVSPFLSIALESGWSAKRCMSSNAGIPNSLMDNNCCPYESPQINSLALR